jgi:GNAT superfamily N-acetyltransferase
MYKVVEEVAAVDDFLRLRKISGLSERPKEATIRALPRSLYGIHIIVDGAAIGMGRIVGDGALNFEIVDVAVDPKHQKQGFGRVIMKHIMAYLDKEAPSGCYVTLMADVPALYEKFGFALVRPASEGMYLIK